MMMRVLNSAACASVSLIFLAACAATATENNAGAHEKTGGVHHEPHTVRVRSETGFDETLAALKSAIESRGFKTFAVIDHAKGAASIDETLRPTTLIIFGNPKGGTPIIQTDQRLGLELPLRALVYEAGDGEVFVTYRDYPHLAKEYDAAALKGRFARIAGALEAITREATKDDANQAE